MSNARRLRLRSRRRLALKSRRNSVSSWMVAVVLGEESGRDPHVIAREYRQERRKHLAFAIAHHISVRCAHFIYNQAAKRREDPNTWERYQIDACVRYLATLRTG